MGTPVRAVTAAALRTYLLVRQQAAPHAAWTVLFVGPSEPQL